MARRGWKLHAPLKVKLAKERQMMSLMEKEMVTVNGDLVWNTENWVQMWVDTGYGVVSDDGTLTAFRGIDDEGTLMWLVRTPGKKFGFHSAKADPFAAMDEARQAWADRRRVRANWDDVRQTAWNLVWGRESFDVLYEDAQDSALCQLGIDAFLRRIGMGRVRRLSGRTAAILMLVDPQLGFVIERAKARTARLGAAPAAKAAILAE